MIKLVSINIQGDNNKETVLPFLLKQSADVVCIQEIFEEDIKMYEEALGMKSFFKPIMYRESFKNGGERDKLFGPAIFTNHKTIYNYEYIVGVESDIPIFAKPEDSTTERNISNIVLLWADITIPGDSIYRISTTHFTWTPDGMTTPYQIEDTTKLIKTLDENLKDFVLVGDLNAPRGKEAFAMLAQKYKDNIPLEYESSIDPKLHRVQGLIHMVDGLFSTKEYEVKDVKLIEGISDHKAVVANIQKIISI